MNFPVRAELGPDHAGTTQIVGLGASAGGLEALEQFLANVPAGSGLAYVVVQHLDPTHKAMLVELLQRATVMPVREATESLRIEPDVVYVIPPNSELSVVRGLLHLAQPSQPRGMRLPIDVLFCSLAREQGDRAIGVVLSGMGSDGTARTAGDQGPGRPDPCAAAGVGAVRLDAEERDRRRLRRHRRAAELNCRRESCGSWPHSTPRRSRPTAGDDSSQQVLESILGLLREHSKHDLSLYKTSTLKRRVERRMGVHSLDTMAAYEEFLRKNPEEFDLLFKEMLIGVTGFFRDPAVWQDLRDALTACAAGAGRRGQAACVRG